MSRDGETIGILEPGERKVEKSQYVILVPGEAAEQAVVQRLFERRAEGASLRELRDELNADGISAPHHGKSFKRLNAPGKWSAQGIRNILTNPAYRGELVYNRGVSGHWTRKKAKGATKRDSADWVRFDGAFEAVVNADLWAKVQQTFKKRAGGAPLGSGRRNSPYLLTHLITCVRCGYPYRGHTKKNGQGRKYEYYEDTGYRDRGDVVCAPTSIPRKLLEGFVIDRLCNYIVPRITPTKITRALKAHLARETGQSTEQKGLQADLAEVERKIENVMAAIEDGRPRQQLLERLAVLDDRKGHINDQLAATLRRSPAQVDMKAAVEQIMALARSLKRLLARSSPKEVRAILQRFVDRIEVIPSEGKALCYFRALPMVPALVDSCPFSHCRRSDR